MKVIKIIENKGILFKGTTKKNTCPEGRFINFLRPLMTAVLPVMKYVLTTLAKSVLIPLGLAASATDATIQNKIYESGTTALIISNEEMEDLLKLVKSFEESGPLMKGISETIKNEPKKIKKWISRNIIRCISC